MPCEPEDDAPIGGALPPEGCSPCSEVTAETLVGLVKSLLDRVCTLETQGSNWHALLERARNRLTAAEGSLHTLLSRGPATANTKTVTVKLSACDGDEVDAVESLVGCNGSEAVKLIADDGQIMKRVDGEWRGVDSPVKWLNPLPAVQALTVSSNQTINVNSLGAPDGARLAVVMLGVSITNPANPAGGSTTISAHVPGATARPAASIYAMAGLGNSITIMTAIPILDDGTVKLDVASTGSPSAKTHNIQILGFF